VVDTLFDQLISFQLADLKAVTKLMHEAEGLLAKKANAQAKAALDEARKLISAMPITETQAGADTEIVGAFRGGADAKTRRAEFERRWAAFAKENYAKARAKAEEAIKLAR
jgi:hypothetical protein